MVEELEVFLVFFQDRVIPFLRSRSLTIQSVPRFRRGFGGGLHGLHPGQSSSAFYGADHRVPAATAEQNVDIPAPRGAPHDFHQNPLPAAGSSDLLETANQGVFGTFPRRKKCEDPAYPGVGTGRGLFMASVSLAGGVAGWLRLGRCPRHASAYGCFWKNFLSFALAWFALGIWCFISVVLVLAVTDTGGWVLLLSTENWI